MKKIKRNKHFMILLLIFILTLGYASVTTILNMNGSVAIKEGEFLIKFNRSVLNGTNRPTFINDSGNQITFQSADITEIGQSTLDYEVVNMSRQYDVNVQVTCTTDAKNVTITNSNGVTKINSGESTSGTVTLDSTKRLEEEGEIPSDAVKLYDKVKSLSQGLDTANGVNYSNSTGQNGVYETNNTDSGNTVYYYRGQVDNNIMYANKCWNIVRTTETGGVKLLYNGIPVNGSCDQTKILSGLTEYIGGATVPWSKNIASTNVAGIGYMYGNKDATSYEEAHKNTTNSVVKNIVDDWYEKNIKDTKYEEMLEDTVYCNDRSLLEDTSSLVGSFNTTTTVTCTVGEDDPDCVDGKKVVTTTTKYSDYFTNLGYGSNPTIFSATTRLGYYGSSINPTLKCKQTNDKFTMSTENGNGALKYPIALLSTDELVYAGASRSVNRELYFVRKKRFGSEEEKKTNFPMWLMTPLYTQYTDTHVRISVYGTWGGISEVSVGESSYVMPSLSLKNDNYIISGDGTADKPYILFSKGLATDKITCTLDIQKIPREELGEEFDGVRSLYDTVKSLSYGTASEKGIDYNRISSDTNGKGVYETSDTDSGKPVYFYRGDVEDNNVVFADKCWQIVRTTSSSGTKLVYNGVVGADGSCTNEGTNRGIGASPWNTKYGDNAYTGYMYGKTGASTYDETHTPTNNTTIKEVVDKWYEDNILNTEYEGYLEDVVFCNDRSPETDYSNYAYPGWLKPSTYTSNGYGTSRTIYQGSGRVGINAGITKPTLKCSQLNDRFTVSSSIGNGALTYPIGLMTADETVFAGSTGGFQGKNIAITILIIYILERFTHGHLHLTEVTQIQSC